MTQNINIPSFTDEQLAESYRKENDNVYLEVLFKRYIRFVFIVSMKYVNDEEKAKDVSMQVFEKLIVDLKRFQIGHFKPWLHTVVRNASLIQLRASDRNKFLSLDEQNSASLSMEIKQPVHPIEGDQEELKLEKLEKAISILEKDQKTCIELFYLHEKSYKEVAELTGFSLNQVKSHVQNGKRNLKNFLVTQDNLLSWLILYWLINN